MNDTIERNELMLSYPDTSGVDMRSLAGYFDDRFSTGVTVHRQQAFQAASIDPSGDARARVAEAIADADRMATASAKAAELADQRLTEAIEAERSLTRDVAALEGAVTEALQNGQPVGELEKKRGRAETELENVQRRLPALKEQAERCRQLAVADRQGYRKEAMQALVQQARNALPSIDVKVLEALIPLLGARAYWRDVESES